MTKRLFLLFLPLLALYSSRALSNNIRIENVEIVDQNTALNTYTVEFDLAWDNSWRIDQGPSNWDAAWVYLKFSPKAAHDWHHGEWYRNSNDAAADGHVFPSSCAMDIPTDQVGAFIYRSGVGNGNILFENIRMIWDYSSESITDEQELDINLYAIEMVYVPEGPFYLGDGSNDTGIFQVASTGGLPFLVDAEDEDITLGGTSSANLSNGYFGSNSTDDFSEATTRNLPAAWPIGYHAMYVMKYEVTGAMYSDFYYTLTEAQNDDFETSGCELEVVGSGYFHEFSNPYRPIHCATWTQAAAFLDWCGLRPLSETEYEKACRGPVYPIPGEFAWGTPIWYGSNDSNDLILQNSGSADEIIVSGLSENNPNAAHYSAYGNTLNYVRVGIFAASVQNPTRENTGATYYGIMEMTGNVSELMVSLRSSATRDFSGLHGNGELASSGNASGSLFINWAFANGDGMVRRSWSDSHPISWRGWEVDLDSVQGFRACRTAP